MDFAKVEDTYDKLSIFAINEYNESALRSLLSEDPVVTQYIAGTDVFDEDNCPVWKDNWPPLHRASYNDCPSLVKLLIQEFGFCPDSIYKWGNNQYSYTPLQCCIENNSVSACKELLKLGADPRVEQKLNGTEYEDAIKYAESRSRTKPEIINLLKEKMKGKIFLFAFS